MLLNDDDLAYAKIRLDEESLAVAIEHLADIESPLARSLVWGAAWDATRDAETAGERLRAPYVTLDRFHVSTATDLADWLVRALKIPFRDAHHVTGRIVAKAAEQGVPLHRLPLAAGNRGPDRRRCFQRVVGR